MNRATQKSYTAVWFDGNEPRLLESVFQMLAQQIGLVEDKTLHLNVAIAQDGGRTKIEVWSTE